MINNKMMTMMNEQKKKKNPKNKNNNNNSNNNEKMLLLPVLPLQHLQPKTFLLLDCEFRSESKAKFKAEPNPTSLAPRSRSPPTRRRT
jgi:hypothetical protein